MMMSYKSTRRNSCGLCLRYCLAVANILFIVSVARPLSLPNRVKIQVKVYSHRMRCGAMRRQTAASRHVSDVNKH